MRITTTHLPHDGEQSTCIRNQCTSNCLWKAIADNNRPSNVAKPARHLKRAILRRGIRAAARIGDLATKTELRSQLLPKQWSNTLTLCVITYVGKPAKAIQQQHLGQTPLIRGKRIQSERRNNKNDVFGHS
eukprot:3261823-Amphidinium_carterae.1